jgi:hypothetical protein
VEAPPQVREARRRKLEAWEGGGGAFASCNLNSMRVPSNFAYNADVSTELRQTLDYAPHSSVSTLTTRRVANWVLRIILLVLLVPAFIVGLEFFGSEYASRLYPRVKTGMTRGQVDRLLWAFGSSPSPYNAVAPTESAVAYEFLWYGKDTRILVIFDAKGVVVSAIPVCDGVIDCELASIAHSKQGDAFVIPSTPRRRCLG